MDFESQIEKIAKDIRDREDREMGLAFTNVVGSLLRENGVFVKTSRYEFETHNETHNETDKNEYIIKKEYGVSFDGLDFTEHDKRFKDEIADLRKELRESKAHITQLEHELEKTYNQLMEVEKDAQERIAELKSELEVKDNLLKIKNGLCEDNGTAKINLNEIVKVKLTPLGAEIYYKQFDELNKECGREICKPQMPQIDKDGYTEFQLWNFIELYGEHIGMCKPNVIEPLDIVYCKNNKNSEE